MEDNKIFQSTYMHFSRDNDNYINDFAYEIIESLGFGVAIIEAETHKIVYANSKALEMSGYSLGDLKGKVCHKLLCPAEVGACPISDLGQVVDNSERIMLLKKRGRMPIIKTVVPIMLDNKKYFIESLVNNSEQKDIREKLSSANKSLQDEINKREEIQKQIKHLAYHDYLTGLPNRLYFNDYLNHAIKKSERLEKMVGIMFLDLDGFKMINDTLGHAIGDKLLVEVAKRLVVTLRKTDIVARIGGDEYVILIENIENMDSMQIIAEKILNCFRKPFVIEHHDFFITTSIGISMYPSDGANAEVLIKNADIAMYKAKENGRNQWVLCTPVMKTNIIETMKLSNQLYRALERNEFELYYQPQVSCNTNQIVGLEALIRWNHPELGLVYPGKFIPISEQTGLIHSIGEWVIRTACIQNMKWQKEGIPEIPIAVNLSVRQFQNPNIVKEIEDILFETGMDPKLLELEITESIAMNDAAYVIETLTRFKEKGIIISIDDFGIEFSSLNYLKQLPVDKIKIAMPFVQGIDTNQKDEAITKAILVLAKSMGLRVIAEGVEIEKQFSFLAQRMCDDVQGYYFYRPMKSDKVEEALRTKK